MFQGRTELPSQQEKRRQHRMSLPIPAIPKDPAPDIHPVRLQRQQEEEQDLLRLWTEKMQQLEQQQKDEEQRFIHELKQRQKELKQRQEEQRAALDNMFSEPYLTLRELHNQEIVPLSSSFIVPNPVATTTSTADIASITTNETVGLNSVNTSSETEASPSVATFHASPVLCERLIAPPAPSSIVSEKPCRLVQSRKMESNLFISPVHGQGAVHRDIKPENLLITRNRNTDQEVLKISGLGLSKVAPQGHEMTVHDRRGTRAFLAPELAHCDGRQHDGPATDVWSMGVTLYVMLHGILPFSCDTDGKMDYHIQREVEHEDTSADLKHLIDRMMEINPSKRITMDQIRSHPWVTDRGANPLISKALNIGARIRVSNEDEKNAVRKVSSLRSLALMVRAVNRFKAGAQRARSRSFSDATTKKTMTTVVRGDERVRSFSAMVTGARDNAKPDVFSIDSEDMIFRPSDYVLVMDGEMPSGNITESPFVTVLNPDHDDDPDGDESGGWSEDLVE
ncbi:hypothetical protein BGZ83_007718 [Gryganskiella cystojenkinii]|nr:hypothetical protein BGZ83_007718 [Gryganskiella cystojenkinii]